MAQWIRPVLALRKAGAKVTILYQTKHRRDWPGTGKRNDACDEGIKIEFLTARRKMLVGR